MNLGIADAPGVPDSTENVACNAQLLMEAAGMSGRWMFRVKQVHGAEVYCCQGTETFGPPELTADAVVSAHWRVAPCVRTADCVPVLLACTATGMVAAVHAGWRGIVAGVISAAVTRMQELGADVGRMRAAIGPCIGGDRYEVGPEVTDEFSNADLNGFVLRSHAWERPHLNCFGAVRHQLRVAGLGETCIDGTELCTASALAPTGPEFFSYRRDGARSGRMASVIGTPTAG
jgi:YfiH family protein